jgi:pyruvate carboxylase
MFRKVLVANRGEIAIRAFRAAYELGCQTVAVFPYEDRNSEHRLKANEAYQIGERGHPVRAYLSVPDIIRAAQRTGADAVYPGYGFLSENPKLAMACQQAGITFIGPPPAVLALAGNKSRAVAAARAAGVPVPDVRQGRLGGWRARDAEGHRALRPAGGVGGGQPGG